MTDNTKGLRALLQVEIDTGIAYRQARGQKFLELVREGDLHPVIWKKLESDPELIELERRSLEAAADTKVAWNRVTNEQKVRHIASMTDQKTPWWLRFIPKPRPEEVT